MAGGEFGVRLVSREVLGHLGTVLCAVTLSRSHRVRRVSSQGVVFVEAFFVLRSDALEL